MFQDLGSWTLEIQDPGSFFRSWHMSGLVRIRTKGAGLLPGPGEAIAMLYVLAAGFPVVLERSWLGSVLGHQIWCGVGLGSGLAFGGISPSLIGRYRSPRY